MKIIVSEELKSRLTNASTNGSTIARDILAEVRKNADVSDIIRGNANYFSTKRKKQDFQSHQKVKVVFTVCTKDLTNPDFPDRNNPEAPWFSENRVDVEPSTFVGYFKHLPDYSEEDLDYFINAICVNSKISVKLYDKMSDFYEAYIGENYSGIAQFGYSSLHNSCMKSEDASRNAADFYVNFAGAKIIIARDSEKNIVGRAIVWENVVHIDDESDSEVTLSVLDRIYFTHDFIIKLIRDYAGKIGIVLRKKQNDHTSNDSFVVLNNIPEHNIEKNGDFLSYSLQIKVPATRWHKKGAPFLDTFYAICLYENSNFYLKNNEDDNDCFAVCRDTNGYATKKHTICPVCGVQHGSIVEMLCDGCTDRYSVVTVFGRTFFGKTIKYNRNIYPNFLFKRGKPNPNLKRHLQIEKLYKQ